jgi:hypothetical protein
MLAPPIPEGMPAQAFMFGLISAASLPLGALVALVWIPRPHHHRGDDGLRWWRVPRRPHARSGRRSDAQRLHASISASLIASLFLSNFPEARPLDVRSDV